MPDRTRGSRNSRMHDRGDPRGAGPRLGTGSMAGGGGLMAIDGRLGAKPKLARCLPLSRDVSKRRCHSLRSQPSPQTATSGPPRRSLLRQTRWRFDWQLSGSQPSLAAPWRRARHPSHGPPSLQCSSSQRGGSCRRDSVKSHGRRELCGLCLHRLCSPPSSLSPDAASRLLSLCVCSGLSAVRKSGRSRIHWWLRLARRSAS